MKYKIKNHEFSSFKLIAHMHHSNYAVIDNEPGLGIKYCPHLSFEEEFFVLRELNHKQIPKAHDYGKEMMYKDEKEVLSQNFIVLDHMSSTDFSGYFKKRMHENDPQENLKKIITCLISACDPLDCIHSKGYVHTDLKPGHLMLNPETNEVSFIDFELVIKNHGLIKGISKDFAAPEHEELLKILRGAPKNMPLEAIANDVGIDGRADIFSLGAVIYDILTDKKWGETKKPVRSINEVVPEELDKIILSMLEEDPNNRIASVKELKLALQNIL